MSGISFNNPKNVDDVKSKVFNKDGLKQIKKAVEAEISEKFKVDSSSIIKNGNAVLKIELPENTEANKEETKNENKAHNAILKEVEKLINEPEGVIKEIRQSRGAEKDAKLLSFAENLDHFNIKELRAMRDYLVMEMASPKNNDDPLLGDLLNIVNKKIDKANKNHSTNKKSTLNITQAKQQFDPFIIKNNENLFAQKPRMSEDTFTTKLNNRR